MCVLLVQVGSFLSTWGCMGAALQAAVVLGGWWFGQGEAEAGARRQDKGQRKRERGGDKGAACAFVGPYKTAGCLEIAVVANYGVLAGAILIRIPHPTLNSQGARSGSGATRAGRRRRRARK
jgi:hypothetical protein